MYYLQFVFATESLLEWKRRRWVCKKRTTLHFYCFHQQLCARAIAQNRSHCGYVGNTEFTKLRHQNTRSPPFGKTVKSQFFAYLPRKCLVCVANVNSTLQTYITTARHKLDITTLAEVIFWTVVCRKQQHTYTFILTKTFCHKLKVFILTNYL